MKKYDDWNMETYLTHMWMLDNESFMRNMARGRSIEDFAKDMGKSVLSDREKVKSINPLLASLLIKPMDEINWRELAEYWGEK